MSEQDFIIQGDNLQALRAMRAESIDLIYIDPPFNTRKVQRRARIKTVRDDRAGDRTGFQGRRYRTEKITSSTFDDSRLDYVGFLGCRLVEARRVLKPAGSLFVHLDYREVHYVKVFLDTIFGRSNFINEIIWSYDYGARSRSRWPSKHDTILWYAMDHRNYTFNFSAIDRIPYMAPDLVGAAKAAVGKVPTDVWWNSIVGTNSKEKTGYPTQKPLNIINRIVLVHSNPGDTVLDFFAGSGTVGEAARRNGRRFILIDNSSRAIAAMRKRLPGTSFESLRKSRSSMSDKGL
jgi:site-specific DNA-methyltransferase (adenine-specific)